MMNAIKNKIALVSIAVLIGLSMAGCASTESAPVPKEPNTSEQVTNSPIENPTSAFKQTLGDLMDTDPHFKLAKSQDNRTISAVMADLDNDDVDEMIVFYYIKTTYFNSEYFAIEYFTILDNESGSINTNDLLVGNAPKSSLVISTNGYLYGADSESTSGESFFVYEYKNSNTTQNSLYYSRYQFGAGASPTITYSFNNKNISQSEYDGYKNKYGLNGGTSVLDMKNVLAGM